MRDRASKSSGTAAGDSFATPIGPPLRIDGEQSLRWDELCDVLIVGFGAAGASAAIEVAREGGEVIVADRFGGGGASAKSGGVVYAGGGTRFQRAAGYEDSPEAMYEYLSKEVGDAVSHTTLKSFCDGSVTMTEWLEQNGVEFDSTLAPRKTSYPPDGYYLYFSGNETVSEYAGCFQAAPRGHRVKGKGLSGARLFGALRKSADAAGVRVMTQAAVRRLIVDNRSGAVLGAELWQFDPDSAAAVRHRRLNRWAERAYYPAPAISELLRRHCLKLELTKTHPRKVQALGGVILCTGGFIFNREMLLRHAPRYSSNFRLGTSGCDGSGIRLGQSVGGETARLERISAWRFINPPLPWVRGMIVNSQGRRFCNEEVYGARLGYEMCEHHGGKAFLVIDSVLRSEAIRETLFGGLWGFQSIPALVLMLAGAGRARSIEELARKMGADRAVMMQSFESYNLAAAQKADPLGKSSDLLQVLAAPPFYALNISADNRVFPCAALTLGGLRVDESTGAVLKPEGGIVAGLYAAGRAAAGIASNHYVSGLALADCIYSGRRAGHAAAANRPAHRAHAVA